MLKQKFELLKAKTGVTRGEAKGAVLGLLVLGMAMQAAHAAFTIDTADVLTAIGVALAAVGTIGVAVLGVRVAVRAFAWVRAALS
ncbi:major capsid protein [Variovorax sp. tm]|uniref:major capsid protein n=1 Tax=Variovorax atrisoli TaxID=3394203 RepID=UPI003A807AF5